MEKLLEHQSTRKLNILFNLSLYASPVSLNDLANHLNITPKTLMSIIEEINQDAERYQQSLKIEKISRNEVILKSTPDFSIFQFKFKYIQDSMLFQILDSSFRHTYKNIQETADFYHLSIASLYRKLAPLKEILKAFNLEFESQNYSPIQGNEKQIYFFFFHFYWHVYKHQGWPFEQRLRKDCTNIYNETFLHRIPTQSPVMKQKIILLLAISIIRRGFGYILDQEDVVEITNFLENDSTHNLLKTRFNDVLNKYGFPFDTPTYTLIYFIITCDEDYRKETNFNFLLTLTKQKTIGEEATISFLRNLSNSLNQPLTDSDCHLLYKDLLKVNMRAHFFTEKIEFFTPERRLDHLQEHFHHYEEWFQKLYRDLIDLGKPFEKLKETPHLYYRFLVLLFDHLDLETIYPKINIAFLLEDTLLTNRYQQKIKTLTASNIDFTFEINNKTDLVITNTFFIFEKEVNYFILNTPTTPWEWNLLKEKLESIRNSKLQK